MTYFRTSNHAKPLMICYSWRDPKPVHLTPVCTTAQATRSITASTTDTATWSALAAPETYRIEKGDWIQIDCTDVDSNQEHYWFGRITSVHHGQRSLGEGGGAQILSSFSAESWGAVFHEFHKEYQLAMQLWVRDCMAADDSKLVTPPPTLAMLTALVKDAHLVFKPYQAVSIVMQFLARYGGKLRQEFWLPPSFHHGRSIPLHWMICKINRTRLDGTQAPLKFSRQKGGSPDPSSMSTEIPDIPKIAKWIGEPDAYELDADDFNFAAVAASSSATEPDPDGTAWTLQDWHGYFTACTYYQSGFDAFGEATKLEDTQDCWNLAMGAADPAWCSLSCTMVEKVDFPPLTGTFEAHDGTKFDRKFLLSVSFKPHPHPVYRAADTTTAPPIIDPYVGGGAKRVEADATGYSLCPKFVLDAGACDGLDMPSSADQIFSYWITTARSELYQGPWYEPIAAGALNNWVIPVIDNKIMGKWGHRPNETVTRYFLDQGGKSFWSHLIRKTLLQYAWTVSGGSKFTGGWNMPVFHANVPRPGDVGIIRGNIDTGRETLDPGPDGFMPRTGDAFSTSSLIEGTGASVSEALSVFVESTQLTFTLDQDAGRWDSSCFCSYSQGQMVSVDSDYDPVAQLGVPYRRFFSWAELGIAIRYWLPWRWDVGKTLADLPLDADPPFPPAMQQALDALTPMRDVVKEPETLPEPEPIERPPPAAKKAVPTARRKRIAETPATPAQPQGGFNFADYIGPPEKPNPVIPPPPPKPVGLPKSAPKPETDLFNESIGTGGVWRNE